MEKELIKYDKCMDYDSMGNYGRFPKKKRKDISFFDKFVKLFTTKSLI